MCLMANWSWCLHCCALSQGPSYGCLLSVFKHDPEVISDTVTSTLLRCCRIVCLLWCKYFCLFRFVKPCWEVMLMWGNSCYWSCGKMTSYNFCWRITLCCCRLTFIEACDILSSPKVKLKRMNYMQEFGLHYWITELIKKQDKESNLV